jgi:hypothetical protein
VENKENVVTQTQDAANNDADTITQNHEIVKSDTQEKEETENKPKKKSWIDSMLDNVF